MQIRVIARWIALVVILLSTSVSFAASLSGTITGPDQKPLNGARVVIIELSKWTFSDSDGSYQFSDVPEGSYHLQAVRDGLGSKVLEVVVKDDLTLDLEIDSDLHREKIAVSATRTGLGSNEATVPVAVLERDAIDANMAPTLGETLSSEPGVSSTYFGPGASRPVIRGQQGARIQMLENGLKVGDASSTSPDHAVSADPFEAESIEILRGPSVLLYGGAATGGVVNVLDGRVPDYVPNRTVEGEFNLRYGSAAEEQAGAIKLRGGGGEFAWQITGFSRETEDVDTPGLAVLNDPASPDGTLFNSALKSEGGSVGVSWIGERGYVGVAYKQFDTLYGIPAEIEEEEEEVTQILGLEPIEEGIRIDLAQQRYDLKAGIDFENSWIRSAKLSLGVTDYEHVELEGTEIGTEFLNETEDGRLEFFYGGGTPSGVFGVQFSNRDFEAIGAEAFVPPSETENRALFALHQFQEENVRFELGLRLEEQDTSALGQPDLSFDGVSGSVGVGWTPQSDIALGATISRSTRFPNAEELYSDGPHLATFSFERGDPTLTEETGVGIDVSLRRTEGRVTGGINLFVNDYNDFILELPTGEIEDGLPVFQFAQDDAEFYGYEINGVFNLFDADSGHLDFFVSTDSVRATASDGNPLPRISPRTHRGEFRYNTGRWNFSAGATHTEGQDRISAAETTTDSYTFVDAGVNYVLGSGRLIHRFELRGRNLTDEEGRVHASRLKDLILLPGRDLNFSYRLIF